MLHIFDNARIIRLFIPKLGNWLTYTFGETSGIASHFLDATPPNIIVEKASKKQEKWYVLCSVYNIMLHAVLQCLKYERVNIFICVCVFD